MNFINSIHPVWYSNQYLIELTIFTTPSVHTMNHKSLLPSRIALSTKRMQFQPAEPTIVCWLDDPSCINAAVTDQSAVMEAESNEARNK